jgi:hypothetical protein
MCVGCAVRKSNVAGGCEIQMCVGCVVRKSNVAGGCGTQMCVGCVVRKSNVCRVRGEEVKCVQGVAELKCV